ncbi:MAG: TadE/TadG family type IV pilus assembly protein [Planctomycetota bacterium]
MRRGTHHDRARGRHRQVRYGSSGLSQSSRRGTAAVEFAMVAPLIFLFFFASIETGRLLMAIHGLDAAAREGCRQAISLDVSSEEVEQCVEARLATFGISGHSLTIEPDPPSGAEQWELITIRILVPYSRVSWLPLPGFLQRVTLSGSCTLPQESKET